MKKHFALALGALTLAFAPAVGATSITDLTTGLDGFVSDATGSLPFAAAAGLDWSDAYIGSIVGVPPHFGLGVTAGATTLPKKAVQPLITALGGSLNSDLPLPSVGVNARVGGFLLPFDVGFKVGVVPGLTLGDYTVDYTNLGFDVRYAVFQGEPLLPDVSVGGGVDYFATKVKATYGSGVSYSDGSKTLTVGAPTATLDLSALVFEAKAQVSKSLLIITPYLGVSALVGSSTAKASVSSNIDYGTGNQAYWAQYVPGISSTGFSKDKSVANFGLKVYGGTSINMVVFKLDLQGLYSFLDQSYGGTLGLRFQL
jgi:hypothetical protein